MTREDFLRWAGRFPDALMLVTSDGFVLACNDALKRLLGRKDADIVGHSLFEWSPAAPESVRAALRLWSGSGQMIFGPVPLQIEGIGALRCEGAVLEPAGGGSKALLVVRIKRQEAAAERFVVLNRKIDELNKEIRARKLSEMEIRKQREWLHVTLSSIGDAVIATDVQGRVEFLNSVAEELTGWKLAEAIGKPVSVIFSIFNEFTRQPVEDPVGQVLRQGIIVGLANHTMLRARSGAERPIEDSAAPICGTDGALIGAVVVFHDVTKQHQDRVALERARDEAVAASRAKDDFLAALSHELRTPLNPVLLLASEAAANPDLSAEVRRDFEIINKNVLLEARLIDDLLDLTRITRGKMPLDLQMVDVLEVVRDSIETVRSDIDAKSLTLTTNFSAEHSIVVGDKTRLQQVCWNLLKNAVKFTPPKGSITIVTSNDARDNLVVEFLDSGVGMTPEELARIFTAFSQGDHGGGSGSHRFGGLGLGLAISRMLVEIHKGEIRATSQGRSQGARLIVSLPLAPREVLTDERPASALSDLKEAAAIGMKKRLILLVEDHKPTRDTFARLMTKRNYEVMVAETVAQALALGAQHKFDLVISDIGLPDGDGNALMRTLRARHGLHGIALSGYGMEQDVTRSREAGFITHLTKPISVHAMETALALVWSKVDAVDR